MGPTPENRFPFIVLEGIDGVGKTSVAKELARLFQSEGIPAMVTKTPMDPFDKIAAEIGSQGSVNTKFLFFLSAVIDASERLQELTRRRLVVCDRYVFTTLAYHRALGTSVHFGLEELELFLPDHAFLLHAEWQALSQRITERSPRTASTELKWLSAATRAGIEEEFAQFPLHPIETTNRSVGDVAEHIRTIVG